MWEEKLFFADTFLRIKRHPVQSNSWMFPQYSYKNELLKHELDSFGRRHRMGRHPYVHAVQRNQLIWIVYRAFWSFS